MCNQNSILSYNVVPRSVCILGGCAIIRLDVMCTYVGVRFAINQHS